MVSRLVSISFEKEFIYEVSGRPNVNLGEATSIYKEAKITELQNKLNKAYLPRIMVFSPIKKGKFLPRTQLRIDGYGQRLRHFLAIYFACCEIAVSLLFCSTVKARRIT